ncbi:MAG TPA: hypothetical protein VJT81_12410 [Burkholderiales bacterium]|nr:hypothetical protein [Burkholderiales bacterium]
MAFAVSAAVASLPEVTLVPDQPPEAVQEVASVEVHVSVDDPPLVTDVGFAASDTVGTDTGGVPDTVTVTDLFAVPPAPLQLSVKVLVALSEPRVSLPEVALFPDQAPEAVQEVAFVDDHVSVDDPPLVTDTGFAVSDIVGPEVVTVTVADALAVPPGPLHASVNVLVLVNAPLDWLPEVALLPDQAPEAEQEVAFVDDHVSVDDPPLATDVGFACSDTVGIGC